MKRLMIIFIGGAIFLLLFIFLFSPNFSRSYHHFWVKETNLSEEKVNGLKLGEKVNRKNLERNRDVEEYDYYELRKGIEVATDKSAATIVRFIVTNDEQETVRGIKIGDSREKVIGEYGENYYTRLEQGLDIIGYVDTKNETSIEFWLGNDGVLMYRYDYQFMK
ncbi:hypothetical protein [Bacillus manliponensis]|uniref:hypothetical protein n=1 Tax=Bacillus manliponensis TaxID=574376 RepID=UPI003515EBD3